MLADDLEKHRPEFEVDQLVADALQAGRYSHTVNFLCEKMIELEKRVDAVQMGDPNIENPENILDPERLMTISKWLYYARARDRASHYRALHHLDLSEGAHYNLVHELGFDFGSGAASIAYTPIENERRARNRVFTTRVEPQPIAGKRILPFEQDMKAHDKSTEMKIHELESKVCFLENQLQNDKPHLQLYKIGAGSLLTAVASLTLWMVAGIAAPFHPIFAAVVIFAALGCDRDGNLSLAAIKAENEMPVDEIINILSRLTPILQIGLVLIILALIGAALYMGFLLLSFGHKAVELALPYAQRLLEVFISEKDRSHPAISLDLKLHYIFVGITVLCIAGILFFHALIPWPAHHMEFILYILVSFGSVSIGLSLREYLHSTSSKLVKCIKRIATTYPIEQ